MARLFSGQSWRKLGRWALRASYDDIEFLKSVDWLEAVVSRVLSIATSVVILVAVVDLLWVLSKQLFEPPIGFFSTSLHEIFGALLSILIALEILENITAYLKKHVVQVELVIATSLTAVARKFIILDLKEIDGLELIGLSLAIIALSASYWLIRKSLRGQPPPTH